MLNQNCSLLVIYVCCPELSIHGSTVANHRQYLSGDTVCQVSTDRIFHNLQWSFHRHHWYFIYGNDANETISLEKKHAKCVHTKKWHGRTSVDSYILLSVVSVVAHTPRIQKRISSENTANRSHFFIITENANMNIATHQWFHAKLPQLKHCQSLVLSHR